MLSTRMIRRRVKGRGKWGILKCISCDKEITLEEAEKVIDESNKLEDVFPGKGQSMWHHFAMMPYERWDDDDWMNTHPAYWFNPLCFNRVMPFTVICEKCAKEYVEGR